MRVSAGREYLPLLVIGLFLFLIKAYDPVRSPVLAALDPWGWVNLTREFLITHELDPFFTQSGYPPTFMYVVAGIASLGADPYDVVRYIPIVSVLNVIPIYLLTLDIFRSHRISALTSVLATTSRLYFMRTSIGNPEGLSHFFFGFMFLFMLRALTTRKWTYEMLAAVFLAVTVLYYHFTLIILLPLLAAMLFTTGLQKRVTAKVLTTIVAPAALFSGIVWYFRFLPEIVHYYFGTRIYTYQIPAFEHSFIGYLYMLVHSVGKSAVVALAELGYAMTLLALVGVLGVFVWRRTGKGHTVGINSLLTYLFVLVFLAIALRTVYNLGIAGAGDSGVYVFGWIAVPAAAFASNIVAVGSNRLVGVFVGARKAISQKGVLKVVTVVLLVLLAVVNLSAVNYYKASSGGGLGILQSHYYYKCLTDEEYYALEYVRDNTPNDAIVIVIGVEQPILAYQAMVAQRTIVSVSNATSVGGNPVLDVIVMFPSLRSTNLTIAEMKLNAEGQQSIYLVTGIRKVNLEVARMDHSPPANTTLTEKLLMESIADLTKYEQVYQNDQVAVLQIFAACLYY